LLQARFSPCARLRGSGKRVPRGARGNGAERRSARRALMGGPLSFYGPFR